MSRVPPPRWTAAATLALAVPGCGSETAEPPEIDLSAPPLVVGPLLADRPETLEDTLGLNQPSDILAVPEGYVIVDTGNDRLVLFDRRLEPLRAVSGTGSGPGELEVPMWAAPAPGGFGVVEMGNMRVSLFGLDGTFRDSFRIPVRVRRVAFLPDGAALVATPTPETYLIRVRPDGQAVPFGVRPDARSDPWEPSDAVRRDEAVAVAGDRVLVLDNTAGRVLSYDHEGSLLGAVRLPDPIVEEARADTEAFARSQASQGRRVMTSPVAKGLVALPDGRAFVLLASRHHMGVVLDPRSLTGRYVDFPADGAGSDRLMSARAAVIDGETIAVLHPFGLSRFALAGDGP